MRRRRKKYTLWAVLGVVLALFLLYQALFGGRGLWRIFRLHREHGRLVAKALELEAENQRLRERIERLQDEADTYELERLAREELGLLRPDEVVYRFKAYTGSEE